MSSVALDGAAGHAQRLHAADRDARQRDGRWHSRRRRHQALRRRLRALGHGAERDPHRAVEQIPGAADVSVEQLTGQAMLTIDVDREAAGRYGIDVARCSSRRVARARARSGEVIAGQRRFDLVLRLDDDARSSVDRIGRILLRSSTGAQVSLSTVARIEIVEGPSTIQREWAKRRVVIQANARDRDVGSFVADVRRACWTRTSIFQMATTPASADSSSTRSAPSNDS
jgi:Cu/Ag efflux pump CusA